ncbi:MAG: hypothetical protein QOD42_751 [Sphingomonadales bacterium]|jgi:hypothetical protein|nr:hypothetical protein [Sphingomonadales bacterium]
MPIQSDDLAALGLGITGNLPPAGSLQPTALVDGIHIQYRTSPDKGFPWYGFYLLRRRHEPGVEMCLARQLSKLPERQAGKTSWPFSGVSLHSSAAIAFIDEFPTAGVAEIALPAAPLEARFDAAPVHRVVATIGFRGEPAREEPVYGLAQFLTGKSEPAARLIESQIAFSSAPAASRQRAPPLLRRGRVGLLNALIAGPAEGKGARLDITLPVASELLIVAVAHPSGTLRVTGYDALGAEMEEEGSSQEASSFSLLTFSRPGLTGLRLESERGELGVYLVFHGFRGRSAAPPGTVRMIARDGADIIAQTLIAGRPGDTVKGEVNGDRIDTVEFHPAAGTGPAAAPPAALIDLCWDSVAHALPGRWDHVPNYPTPMPLPVAESAYPCVTRPSGQAAAQSAAMARIRYDAAANWAPRFPELHAILAQLVAGGPGGGAMNQRKATFVDAVAAAADPDGTPKAVDENLLELLTLASLDPAMAQMLGLYWVDDQVAPGQAYDYLVLADHADAFHGQAQAALDAANGNAIPAGVDAWITFNHAAKPRPPLPPPPAPRAYVLPEAALSGDMSAARGAVGLGWAAPPDPGLAGADAAVRYHLWRRDYGAAAPGAPAGPFTPLDPKMPYLAGAGGGGASAAAAAAKMPANWPPMPLQAVERRLADGWYGFRLSSICLFGRHSDRSGDGSWWQWQTPDPAPWYYQLPAADKQLHGFAVEIRDMQPPPAPAMVEASALDPADEDTYVRDGDYNAWWHGGVEAWWDGLTAAQRAAAVPLRVRWRWYPTQAALHPGTTHFRLYFNPGSTPPGPDSADPASWQDRIFVCPYAGHFKSVAATGTDPAYRQYEVLLPLVPPPGAPAFPGVPLQPSLATPVVYANIAVTAANSKPFGVDHPKWAAGPWGGRIGIEGKAAAATIYRVWRTLPPAPAALNDDARVWATRADYHSMSFYTHRWPASAGMKAHVYAVMDSTLFMVERMNGAATALTTDDMNALGTIWASVPPNVIAELTALRALKPGAGKPAWEAACLALGDGALRGLAALPLHEDSYMRQTVEPVDPPDAAGPDDPAGYAPTAAWRAWRATFDGRARNRYFLRAAYIDAAHNEGPMGPPSPPIYLPPAVPPRTPVITRVTGGDRQATIAWTTANAEAGGRYLLYRTDNDYRLRDVRLMEEAAMIFSADLAANTAEAEWTDAGLEGGKVYYYCLVFEDMDGNASVPSKSRPVNVVDLRVPDPPAWVDQIWLLEHAGDNVLVDWPDDDVVPVDHRPVLRLTWATALERPAFVLTRRQRYGQVWSAPPGIDQITPSVTEAGRYSWIDRSADPAKPWEYRLRVRAPTGVWSTDYHVLSAGAPLAAEEA